MRATGVMITIKPSSRPADPERHDPRIGQSQPCASTWDWEKPYNGPPEDGQPRQGSACPAESAPGESAGGESDAKPDAAQARPQNASSG
jgi:hypothetical protein